jgi:hypothetical protein
MMHRKGFGFAVLTSVLLAAGHGSAGPSETVDARVGNVDITQGKVRAAFLRGAQQDVLPGDKGFFTKAGAKVPGSDFEVYRVGDRLAWTMTSFATFDELRFRTSLSARITTTRTCKTGGKKADFGEKGVATGRNPPKGFEFATVMTAEPHGDTSIVFTIDKGTADGVMPSSTGYAIMPGTGMPQPYAIDITWVTATTAGGYVHGVPSSEEASKTIRKLGYEIVTCKKK